MTRWEVHQGDNQYVTHVLREEPQQGQREGDRVDLTGIQSLHVAGQRVSDGEVVLDQLANVIDLSEGEIAYPVSSTMSATAGLYRVEFIATWPGNIQKTYPTRGKRRSWFLNVRPDIAGMASPLQTAPPSIGGTPVVSTLFVGDGETATVSTQGAVVFASATANILVQDHVDAFSIAPWTAATAWGVGNVPTIGQAGSTIDPSVVSFMEAATGDAVVVAKNTSTSIWFGASSTQGSAVLEIGQGSVLPVDGTVYQLFDLEGDAILPDGMYRWNESSGSWAQVG